MKITLRDKFAVPVILFSVFVFLGQGFWQYSQAAQQEKEEFILKSRMIMDFSSLGLGLSLWEYNMAAIRASGEAIFQDQEVALVRISSVNREGAPETVLFQGGKNGEQYQGTDVIMVEREIVQRGQKVGTLQVALTEAFRNERLQSQLTLIAGQNLLVLLALWGIIFLVAQRVSRPITRLAETMEQVAAEQDELGDNTLHGDELTEETDWPGEIRQLYGTFTQMAAKIHNSIAKRKRAENELRRAHDELEWKVEERTRELFAANQTLLSLNEEILTVNEALQNTNRALNSEVENRRRTEERLAVGEEQYRRLFEELISGAVLCEVIYDRAGRPLDYRLLQANRAFERLTGLGAVERVGKKGQELDFVWTSAFVNKCFRIAANGGHLEYEHFSRELERHYEVKVFSPKQGQFAMLFQDISERKKMEAGLVQAKEDLEIRVEERTAALRQAKAMLENEVTLAADVQKGLLPRNFDDLLLTVRAIYSPYHLVSGDFYDYAWSQEHKRFSGFILDVSGHGVASSLQGIVVSTYFRDVLDSPMRLPAKLNWINRNVSRYFTDDTYVAAIYFELDFRHWTFSFSTAGIYGFLAACDALPMLVKKGGSFIGIDDNPDYQEWTVPFRPGDTFYFLSDGIWDQLPGLEDGLQTAHFEQTVGMLRELAESEKRRDDCCALCVRISDHPTFPIWFEIDRPGEYERIRSRIRSLLGNVAGQQADMVDIVLGEALNNGMRQSMNVTIKISVLKALLLIRVRDGGQGFDGNARVAAVAGGTESAFEERLFAENGRGILIMTAWMDRVIYNQRGNEVLLVKRLLSVPQA